MADALAFVVALLFGYCGVACFAMAKAAHWEQARGAPMPRGSSTPVLYGLGVVGLAASLGLCLVVDHVSMASLVWVMLVTTSAFLVTMTLAWRPRWLAWLTYLSSPRR